MSEVPLYTWGAPPSSLTLHPEEREFCIDNLLLRIHLIIEMVLVDRPCAMGVEGVGGVCNQVAASVARL